jgi:hypothetical protein
MFVPRELLLAPYASHVRELLLGRVAACYVRSPGRVE